MKSTPTPRASRACPPLRLERTGRGARRSGQALLLAVLLMVFAALLGATMITLVSSNLNQTTRQGGLSAARAASTAAISLVNDRLTNSVEADNWRPWQDSPPPRAGQPGFNNYFSAFERSKGWVNEVNFQEVPLDADNRNGNGITYGAARTAVPPDTREMEAERFRLFEERVRSGQKCYVKFPDPRGPITNASGPQYLVEVRPRVDAAGNPTGTLKITVIGTSEDEPGAFDLQVADKPSNVSRGPFSYARYDGNYDYKGKTLSRTRTRSRIATDPTDPNTLLVDSTVGLDKGRTVIIGDDPATAQPAIVVDVDPVGRTIRVNIAATATVGVPVTAASPLMDAIADADFDADNDGTTFATMGHAWEKMATPVRNSELLPRPGARNLWFNGGVALEGQSAVTLGGSNTPNDPRDDDTLSVAGLIAAPTGVANPQLATPAISPALPALEPFPHSRTLRSTPLEKLVRDNRGPEASHIQPLTPPSIDGENSRYRELTQFGDVLNGSRFGFGQGVYIDNSSDIEKKTDGTRIRPLTIAESHRFYANKDTVPPTPPTLALPFPATAPSPVPPYTVAATLEERHVRGWNSPWGFLPRGTSIELKDNFVIFTREDRSDDVPGGPFANRPNPNKAWKNFDGTPLPMGINTYRMVLDLRTGQRLFGAPGAEQPFGAATPFNGVIFAEGNVRVRGFLSNSSAATAATTNRKSITIVSQGSIFVEGSLLRDMDKPNNPPVDAPRLALLAKRNVVLNMTQWPARVFGSQDNDTADVPVQLQVAATAGANTVTVDQPGVFRVGDVIRVANDRLWHQVTQIAEVPPTPPAVPPTAILTLSTPLENGPTGTVGAVGEPVRRLSDPDLKTVTLPAGPETFYDVAPPVSTSPNNSEVLARNINFDGVPTAGPYYFSRLHGAEPKVGISFERTFSTGTLPTPVPGAFHSKEKVAGSTTPTVFEGKPAVNEKMLVSEEGSGTFNSTDLLDIDNNGRDNDVNETLSRLTVKFASAGTPPFWATNVPPALTNAPARRLSAVGFLSGPADDITVPGTQRYSLPLAVSGGWFFQPNWAANANSLLSPGVSGFQPAPWRTIGVSLEPDGDDDLETTRQDFYQTGAAPAIIPPPPTEVPLRWSTDTLNALPNPIEPNVVTFSHDPDLIAGATQDVLPNYRVGPVRVERDNFALPAAPRPYDAVPFYVQATMFAQEGSWFVVTPSPTAIPTPDANNDGDRTDPEDLAAATRYLRPNYRVVVKGSIVQNFTPTGRLDENGGVGAMQGWIKALSHPTIVESNAGDTPAPTVPSGRGRDWQGIEYQADPLPFYNNLYLPPTPDLLYTS